MEKIKDLIAQWEYPKGLPQEYQDFNLVNYDEDKDTFGLFKYENLAKRRAVLCFYNKVTGDFMLRRVYGLNEYNDMFFITPKLEAFEELLQEKLFLCLDEMGGHSKLPNIILQNKGIFDWDFQHFLPEAVAGFELFITPRQPVKLINGSYILVDYSDFAQNAQLVIFYNELRAEYYAEKKVQGLVETINCFDAKSLKELEKKLEELPVVLKSFQESLA